MGDPMATQSLPTNTHPPLPLSTQWAGQGRGEWWWWRRRGQWSGGGGEGRGVVQERVCGGEEEGVDGEGEGREPKEDVVRDGGGDGGRGV